MLRLLKKALCLCLAVLMVCCLFGCSKSEKHTPYSICQKVLPLCSEEISWTSLSSEQAAAYYGVSSALLQNFAAYISDDDTRYDAVAAFTFKNGDEKKELADCFAEILNSNKASVGLVNHKESSKIQKSIIMELNDMLILVAVENAQDICGELEALGARKYMY